MSLPKSVQAQAEQAAKHFEAIENPEQPAPEPESKQPEAPESGAQPAPNQSEELPGEKRSEAYWEHRFNVINGKYAAEVPALRKQIKDLENELIARDERIRELEQSGGTGSAGTGHPDLTPEQLEQFKEEFGEDIVSFVERMVAAKSGTSIKSVKELEQRLQQFEQKDRQKSESLFWAVLGELVPDYRTVNGDPEFHAFLSQIDPTTGMQRQQMLVNAQQALDAQGVADLFLSFKKQARRHSIPEQHIEPRTSRATETPAGAKIWTGSEIAAFYRDKTAGRYSKEEAERLEADIFAAQREGRVR